jgi:hypothetical protein
MLAMRPWLWLYVIATLLIASPAVACPLCASPTGQQVRAGIATDFGYHLAAIGLPFVVFLLIVYVIHSGWPLKFRRISAPSRSWE